MSKLIFFALVIFICFTNSRSESASAKSNSSTTITVWDALMKGRKLDFARTLSSVKSVFGSPFTTLAYLGSMAVGAIVMLAFYESPLSPLRVPPLPDPPIGRFPPENPIWPPKENSYQQASASEVNSFQQGPPYRVFNRRTSMESANPSEMIINPYHKPGVSSQLTKKPTLKSAQPTNFNFERQTLNQCNGTKCEESYSQNTTKPLDKPKKLFDILMPRSSDNVKQN